MPPRGRKSKAAGPKTKKVNLEDLSPEEQKRRENIDLLLKDYDKQMESRVAEMEREADGVIKAINTMYKLDLMKLPMATRKMKWNDYFAQCEADGSNPLVLSEAMTQVLEDVRSEVDTQVSRAKTAAKSTAKKKPRATAKKANKTLDENSEPPASTVRRSNRRGRGQNTSSNSSVLSDSSNIETPATTRGGRGRKGTSSMVTPSTSTRSSSRGRGPPPDVGRTPFITPRFNTATPLHSTVSRVARANEVLVSLDGSPVVPLQLRTKAAQAQAAQNALIPLGNGQTLNLPTGPDSGHLEGVDLDDEAMSKLAAIHASLGHMLKIRNQSSASSEEN